MNSTSSYFNNQEKLYDTSYMSYHHLNEDFEETAWPVSKKMKQMSENYIPVENFICGNKSSNDSSLFPIAAFDSNFGFSKCSKCEIEKEVQKHGYCRPCYEQINSPLEPLITKYKIRCNGCHGWALGLVGEDGFCKYCRYSIDRGIKIKTYASSDTETIRSANEPMFVRCKTCGGWGKDLVKENGQCKYCTNKQEKLVFEAKWKTKCKGCKGWGLNLVKEDGLCNYCRRQQADEKVFFSKVLNQTSARGSENQNINMHINWNMMDNSVLGKRPGDKEDEFYL